MNTPPLTEAALAAAICADELLNHVWNHMHGQNMDGTWRAWEDHERCADNWNKLSDAIGVYLSKDET